MDLSDIFNTDSVEEIEKKKEPESSAEIAASLGDDELEAQARLAASAFDATETRKRIYEAKRDRLLEEVDQQLIEEKAEWDSARGVSEAAIKVLYSAMDKAGITKIPMPDRKPIKLKEIVGRKKPITRKWLTETYGGQRANEIWSKVPNYPNKKEVVIPPRFEDEPSD
jgi:hypothetical protein